MLGQGAIGVEDVRSTDASERLLEDSWATRSRRVSRRELIVEAIAALLFLLAAGLLAVLGNEGQPIDPWVAGLLVVLYAVVSRIEFPVGTGYFVPSYLVLVPMLVMLPPAVVPLLTALALVLGAAGQWLTGHARPERLLFSIPDAWHAVGAALVLVLFADGQIGVGLASVYVAALIAAYLFDLLSATAREAAALGVTSEVQVEVVTRVWLVDACLAPIGLLIAAAASEAPARLLYVLPLSALLFVLARDRTARIAQAQQRLEQAFTDPLTGLGNRRMLAGDLGERIASASAEEPLALVVLDLNGFKGYNDRFGHAAGDALLARLGAKLAAAVAPRGVAYRLGGDEFCVLAEAGGNRGLSAAAAATAALTEEGEEFAVSAARGVVLVPDEADDPDLALRLADERMYGHKHGRSAAEREQAQLLLTRSMETRHPAARRDSQGVAEYAARVGRALGMDAEEIDVITRAGELHDLGKVGIPDAILEKAGALDESEWEIVRQHTILGARILDAAPPLRPVARIVRATHERWDGRGYPDGLAGKRIPLGARIVSVCDAYVAMTGERPYARRLSRSEACRELRREAGRQFDAGVVEAFLAELAAGSVQAGERRSPALRSSELDNMTTYLRELMQLRRAARSPGQVAFGHEGGLGS